MASRIVWCDTVSVPNLYIESMPLLPWLSLWCFIYRDLSVHMEHGKLVDTYRSYTMNIYIHTYYILRYNLVVSLMPIDLLVLGFFSIIFPAILLPRSVRTRRKHNTKSFQPPSTFINFFSWSDILEMIDVKISRVWLCWAVSCVMPRRRQRQTRGERRTS